MEKTSKDPLLKYRWHSIRTIILVDVEDVGVVVVVVVVAVVVAWIEEVVEEEGTMFVLRVVEVLVVMETGSVPIQNVATQISHGELNAIAVTKSDLKGWEVETNLVVGGVEVVEWTEEASVAEVVETEVAEAFPEEEWIEVDGDVVVLCVVEVIVGVTGLSHTRSIVDVGV